MKKHVILSRAVAVLAAALVLFGPVTTPGIATTSGPPSGYTGAPLDGNCTACHSSYALNSGTASFSIAAPVAVTPGAAQSVTVAFAGSASTKHGFQITARDATGVAAGVWAVTQTGMTKNASGTTSYHEQTSSGCSLSSWSMSWTPPATLPHGPMTLYACGLDTNNNGSTSGDHAYTAIRRLYQATLATPSTNWPTGTSQTVTLNAPGHAGDLYFIVPSDNPTPFVVGATMSLEVDPTFFLNIVPQFPTVFVNMSGVLGGSAQATATINIPYLPSIAGMPFYFAAVTAVTVPATAATEVSNRVTITFQ